MYPGSQLLDASLLVMPLVKFAGPTDPRFLATLDRISAELVSDSLVNRYALTGVDGIADGEGTFNLCSFWYVEALTRAGRVREARMVFEKMLTYANHLGLYAEQIGALRRGARQLPPGLHPPGPDQRRRQPRRGPRPPLTPNLQCGIRSTGLMTSPACDASNASFTRSSGKTSISRS